MGSSESWISIQEVANILGVSAPRVRQLVQERKLPEPTKFGERASLWSRADVEALRYTQDGKGVVSGRTALQPTPATPLRRTVDDVHTLSRNRFGGGHFKVHVRIFQGVVEDVTRTVVILSELPDGGTLTNWFEDVANEVTARYLNGHGHAVTWIQTHFPGTPSSYQYVVDNVTMQLDPVQEPAAGAENWLDRLVSFGRSTANEHQQPTGYQHPNWHSSSIQEVHRVLGQSIEWYPVEGYSLREIEHWQRTGRAREVEVDPLELKPLVDALDALAQIPRAHPFSKAARTVCGILANIAMVKEENKGRLDLRNAAADFLEERQQYYAGAGITTIAATLVPYRLSGDDSSLVLRHATAPLSMPWDNDVNAMTELYLELRRWREETDQYSPDHDEKLHTVLSTALGWVNFPAVREELKNINDVYPYGHTRAFMVAGEWDRRYLESIDFSVKIDPDNRVFRMLREQSSYDRSPTRYGYDPFNNMVAYDNDPERPTIRVYWPTRPQQIPLDGQVVADGSPGDRPAYIAKRGHIVGLLPQLPAFHHNGWNFGYGGGGPGRLAGDILEALMWQEELPRERMPRRWTDDAVCHSDQNHLVLEISDIMRRLDTETR